MVEILSIISIDFKRFHSFQRISTDQKDPG